MLRVSQVVLVKAPGLSGQRRVDKLLLLYFSENKNSSPAPQNDNYNGNISKIVGFHFRLRIRLIRINASTTSQSWEVGLAL
jgi:hypothetical protein